MEEKIGILGGTFDPIHNGHINIAKQAKKEFSLDRILFMPSGNSYMKEDVTDAKLRFEMTKIAIKGSEGFEISDMEIVRGGKTYTFETIQSLHQRYPDATLYFIIGMDTLFMIEKWKNPDILLSSCILLVANRQGDYVISPEKKAQEYRERFHAQIFFMENDNVTVSSSEIRNFRKDNPDALPDCFPIQSKVAKYIVEHDLYLPKDIMIQKELEKILKPKRLEHTKNVAQTASDIARHYHADAYKAYLAGLLHDNAKCISAEKKLEICRNEGVVLSKAEEENPDLLHAKAGSILARKKFGIQDEDILNAIQYHTTGRPDMSLLEKIIFVSDYIEPGRTHSSRLPFYRELVYTNLDRTVGMILQETLDYLNENQNAKIKAIDPMTHKTFQFYKKFLDE